MQQAAFKFGGIMFTLALVMTVIKTQQLAMDTSEMILNALFGAVFISAFSTSAYLFGLKKVAVAPEVKQILLSVAFAYFVGYSVAGFLGLFATNWFAFAGIVVVLSYFSAFTLGTKAKG